MRKGAAFISMIQREKLQMLISLCQRRWRQMSDKRVGQKIKLLSVDELLGVPNSEGCVDIEVFKT